jgi:hypothetical protein
LTTRQLLRLYSGILTELLSRKVIRSRNAPAGDLAEHLVAAAYEGKLADASEKSWDVSLASGTKLQVKCRVIAGDGRRSETFSPFRSWDFDSCVFVLLDSETYGVVLAVELPVDAVRGVAYDTPWVRGHRMSVGQLRSTAALGRDVTPELRLALEAI